MNDNWKKIAHSDEIKEGELYVDEGVDDAIMLTRVGETICACGRTCPHHGAPLEKGSIKDGIVTCPYHNAQFKAETGAVIDAPALDDLSTYEVKTENGEVYVGAESSHPIVMPEGSDKREVLIVGAGAAANACAEMLRRRGFSGRLTLFTKEHDLPYDRVNLSKGFISGGITGDAMLLRSKQFYDSLEIGIETDTEVIDLDPREKEISLSNNEKRKGDMILIASGGRPKKLPIDGMNLDHVHMLRSWEDARRIQEEASKINKIAIIGAGFISMELASDFAGMGKDVTVIAPEKSPGALVFGEKVGDWFQSLAEENGVSFRMGTQVNRLTGDRAVRSLDLSDGSTLPADLVIVAVGIQPAVDFLKSSGLVKDGVVPVNQDFKTEADSIYAAGDIASYPYPALGRQLRVEHWVEAERQGRSAALSMLGETNGHRRAPFFWTMQYGTPLKFAGFPSSYDKTALAGDIGSGSFAVGYYSKDQLIGTAAVMMPDILSKTEQALSEGKNITPEDFTE